MLNIEKIEALIKTRMDEAHVPGLAISIIKDNEVFYEKGFGYTSIGETALPVTPNTLFCIGSVTKPLTGVALMKLVEEGILDLDLPVINYLPWFRLEDELSSKKVTLRMLLSHTAGLPHVFDAFGELDAKALENLVKELPKHPLLFTPGRNWYYSDLGIDVAGFIGEVISGKQFKQFMVEQLFNKLAMTRTTFDPLVAMTYPLALSHYTNKEGELSVKHRFVGNFAHNPSSFAMSTVRDMSKFAMMLLKKGNVDGVQFLSTESIEEMFKMQADYFMPNQSGYGLTFETENYKGIRRTWHDGALQSFGSWFYIAPDHGLSVILTCNKREGFWDYGVEIINSIFDMHFGLKETTKLKKYNGKTIDLSLCEGTYYGPWVGALSIKNESGTLIVYQNETVTKLEPFGQDRFIGKDDPGFSVGFLDNAGQPITDLMVDGIPCEKVSEIPGFEFNVKDYSPYLGSFQKGNDELRFHMVEGKLFCYDKYDKQDRICTFLSETIVTCGDILIDFQFGKNGTVNAIRLNKGSIMGKIN